MIKNTLRRLRPSAFSLQPLALLAALLLLPGCAGGPRPLTPDQWGTLAETASYTGAYLYLEHHPEARAKFVVGKAALDLAIADGRFSPADLHDALAKLGVNALSGATGVVVVDAAVVLVTTLQGGVAPLDQAPIARAVFLGISSGLGDALKAP